MLGNAVTCDMATDSVPTIEVKFDVGYYSQAAQGTVWRGPVSTAFTITYEGGLLTPAEVEAKKEDVLHGDEMTVEFAVEGEENDNNSTVT